MTVPMPVYVETAEAARKLGALLDPEDRSELAEAVRVLLDLMAYPAEMYTDRS